MITFKLKRWAILTEPEINFKYSLMMSTSDGYVDVIWVDNNVRMFHTRDDVIDHLNFYFDSEYQLDN